MLELLQQTNRSGQGESWSSGENLEKSGILLQVIVTGRRREEKNIYWTLMLEPKEKLRQMNDKKKTYLTFTYLDKL